MFVSCRGVSGFQLPNLKAVSPSIGVYQGIETPTKTGSSPPNVYTMMSPRGTDANTNLRSELSEINTKEQKDSLNKSIDCGRETSEKGQLTDVISMCERNVGTSKLLKCPSFCRLLNGLQVLMCLACQFRWIHAHKKISLSSFSK